jgi:hexosaminidase
VDRIQNYLSAKGKEIITWDEALEGGVNSNVNVMYWRDWAGGVPEKTVNNGNKIIFVPTSPLYFSQRDSSLYSIYNVRTKFDAIPKEKQYLIRGAQACIWAEGAPSENIVNRRVYPRLLALSEATWTQKNASDWSSFKQRLPQQFTYLDTEHVKHPSMAYSLIPFMSVDEKEKNIRLELESEQIDPVILYTTDGSTPTERSQRYKNGISVTDSAKICAAIFDNGTVKQPVLKRNLDYHKAIGKPVTYHTTWNKAYPAKLEYTLTDGLRGSERHNDGFWQGFTTDMDVTIDMQEQTFIQSFSAMFMQTIGPGIYMPEYVEVSLSNDGNHFEKALVINNDVPETERMLVIRKFAGEIKKTARYVKVFVKNKAGHFIFTDELVIY